MNASQGTLFPITTPETPSTKLPFKQWQLREGERLYNRGAPSLSNSELLAHITRDQQVAERLMRHFGTLEAISDASMDELQQVNGVGKSTAEMIVAAFELGLRGRKRSDNLYTISSPQSVVELLSLEMKVLKQEEMRILLLDTRNNVRKVETVSSSFEDRNIFIWHKEYCRRHPKKELKDVTTYYVISILIAQKT